MRHKVAPILRMKTLGLPLHRQTEPVSLRSCRYRSHVDAFQLVLQPDSSKTLVATVSLLAVIVIDAALDRTSVWTTKGVASGSTITRVVLGATARARTNIAGAVLLDIFQSNRTDRRRGQQPCSCCRRQNDEANYKRRCYAEHFHFEVHFSSSLDRNLLTSSTVLTTLNLELLRQSFLD